MSENTTQFEATISLLDAVNDLRSWMLATNLLEWSADKSENDSVSISVADVRRLAARVRAVEQATQGVDVTLHPTSAALAAAQKRIAELEAALTNLINAADDGEWHLSVDCEAEHRADGCPLCVTLGAARALLSFNIALRREEEGK